MPLKKELPIMPLVILALGVVFVWMGCLENQCSEGSFAGFLHQIRNATSSEKKTKTQVSYVNYLQSSFRVCKILILDQDFIIFFMRLDIFLKKNFGIQSRSKASDLIAEGKVMVNGEVVKKYATIVKQGAKVEVDQDVNFVSRAAYKLKYFLEEIPDLKLENLNALDVGSSTGGFTQVLLEGGVERVTCVDVGSKQLHPRIRANSRVSVFEKCDIRDFNPPEKFDIITCDIAFISLSKVLDKIDKLARKHIILLFKPQFEIGPGGKENGIVKDRSLVDVARAGILAECARIGWRLCFDAESRVPGRLGNREEFLYYQKD